MYLSKEFGEDEEILVYFSASEDPMETEYGRDENEVDDIIDEGVGDEDIEEEFSVTIMKTGSGKQLEFFCHRRRVDRDSTRAIRRFRMERGSVCVCVCVIKKAKACCLMKILCVCVSRAVF